MPEIVHALRAAEKAGAEDDIGATVEDGLEQLGIVAGVVFEIGILYEDDFARGFREAAAYSGAFALILRVKEKAEIAKLDGIIAVVGGGRAFAAGLASGQALEDLASAVGGAVVDHEDFLAHGAFDYTAEDFVDRGFFVVDRDNHGELGVVESGWVAARGHRDRIVAAEAG